MRRLSAPDGDTLMCTKICDDTADQQQDQQ
jgi:hypothetical protein